MLRAITTSHRPRSGAVSTLGRGLKEVRDDVITAATAGDTGPDASPLADPAESATIDT